MKKPFLEWVEYLFLNKISVARDHATIVYKTPRMRVIRFVQWWSLAAMVPHLSIQHPRKGVEDGRLLFMRLYPVTVLIAWTGTP